MKKHISKKNKAVVIYSGGLDSFTLLHKIIPDHNTYALTFDYGQKHGKKELECAHKVCIKKQIDHKIVDISAIQTLMQNSSLIDKNHKIPEGNYTKENMKTTVVPNRNMVLLSLAISYAISINAEKVYYGAHAGDHTIYPDCRPDFVNAMNAVAQKCDWNKISIITPFLHLKKNEILRQGLDMKLDYSQTWTCYNGNSKACGKCGACTERLEAFRICNSIDPIKYQN